MLWFLIHLGQCKYVRNNHSSCRNAIPCREIKIRSYYRRNQGTPMYVSGSIVWRAIPTLNKGRQQLHRARTSMKKIDKLIGLTTFHRMTSWISALTYGNFPLSRILTTLMPTTRSISSWALTCFSGCSAIRRINVNTVAYVFKKKTASNSNHLLSRSTYGLHTTSIHRTCSPFNSVLDVEIRLRRHDFRISEKLGDKGWGSCSWSLEHFSISEVLPSCTVQTICRLTCSNGRVTNLSICLRPAWPSSRKDMP